MDDANCHNADCSDPDDGDGFEAALTARYRRLSLLTLDLAEEAGEAARDFSFVDRENKTGRFERRIAAMTRAIWAHRSIESLRRRAEGGAPGAHERSFRPDLRQASQKAWRPDGRAPSDVLAPGGPASGPVTICADGLAGGCGEARHEETRRAVVEGLQNPARPRATPPAPSQNAPITPKAHDGARDEMQPRPRPAPRTRARSMTRRQHCRFYSTAYDGLRVKDQSAMQRGGGP